MKHIVDFKKFSALYERVAIAESDKKEFTLPYYNDTRRWYSLTFQSNEDLNEASRNLTKQLIAYTLVEQFRPNELCSYVHSNILFVIDSQNHYEILEDLYDTFSVPLIANNPPLLVNTSIIAQSKSKVLIRIYGSESMNDNFLESINSFYP